MIYSEHALPAEAHGFGLCIWRFAVEKGDPGTFTHVIPPDGTVNLAVSLVPGRPPYFSASGPSAQAHLIQASPGLCVAGIRLQPGAAPILLTLPAADFVNRRIPLVARPEQSRLIDTLAVLAATGNAADNVGAVFTELCHGKPRVDPMVVDLARHLRTDPFMADIGTLSCSLALSPRHVRRRFREATGLPPKAFAGIQRLRHAAMIALETPSTNWAQVAAEAGFADQSHFNRDVARCFGTTPTQLLEYLGTIRHAFV